MKTEASLAQKFDFFLTKLLRWWGVLFRTLFIGMVGFMGYSWVDPGSIGDTPFSQLTLSQLFNKLLAVGIALVCIAWLFMPPERIGNEEDPFSVWGQGGFLIIFFGGAWFFLAK